MKASYSLSQEQKKNVFLLPTFSLEYHHGGVWSLAHQHMEEKRARVTRTYFRLTVITLWLKGNHRLFWHKHDAADETFVDGHSAADWNLLAGWMRNLRFQSHIYPTLMMCTFPLACSLFLHDVHIHCSEEVLQRFNGRGQPGLFGSKILFHHAFQDIRLMMEENKIKV